MLRKIRIVLAALTFVLITLLFLDFTGALKLWFGWMAEIQFLPAVLALNFCVVAALIVLTLLFGRVYCSVICPLGIMQDIISWFSSRRKGKKMRFGWKKEHRVLRYGILAVFVVLIALGFTAIASLIAPYGAFGRIATYLFAPIYGWGNNLLAAIAEHFDNYAFYGVDVYVKSLSGLLIAAVTFVLIAVLAWKGGRTWCNDICPVGAILALFSRFSLFRPVIDTEKCIGCGKCGKMCKASCIDTKNHSVDMSRCVVCMDCIENCSVNAISYKLRKTAAPASVKSEAPADKGRREALTIIGLAGASAALKAQEQITDGGLAVILDKKVPAREVNPKPAGSLSIKNFTQHCITCQLCVSACPNKVLRPSTNLETLMQPEMSFEKGYCRPECTRCSDVCPAGAITKISKEEKSSIQIGHAVWIAGNCIVNTEKVNCGNCARHCPSGAITMVTSPENKNFKIPSIDTERCIGCGACENLCPARPLSAIYVEGHLIHKEI